MDYSYSPESKSFYTSANPEHPSDAIELTQDQYQHFINALSQGRVLIVDENGSLVDTEAPPASDEVRWSAVQIQAQLLLDGSDRVAIRCLKAGVPFPSDWQAYVATLREIVRTTNGDPDAPLPTRPTYPAGT